MTQRKRLVFIHGNRFLLHLILNRLKENEGFTDNYLSSDEIKNKTESLFVEIWEQVYKSMEEHFSDSYPASIFKNVGRLKELI